MIFQARNAARAEEIEREIADTSSIVIGDMGTVNGALDIADQARPAEVARRG